MTDAYPISKENLQLDPSAARGAQGRRAIRKDHCPGSVIQRVFAETSRKKQVRKKRFMTLRIERIEMVR